MCVCTYFDGMRKTKGEKQMRLGLLIVACETINQESWFGPIYFLPSQAFQSFFFPEATVKCNIDYLYIILTLFHHTSKTAICFQDFLLKPKTVQNSST